MPSSRCWLALSFLANSACFERLLRLGYERIGIALLSLQGPLPFHASWLLQEGEFEREP